jgi:hypothetical protein
MFTNLGVSRLKAIGVGFCFALSFLSKNVVCASETDLIDDKLELVNIQVIARHGLRTPMRYSYNI